MEPVHAATLAETKVAGRARSNAQGHLLVAEDLGQAHFVRGRLIVVDLRLECDASVFLHLFG